MRQGIIILTITCMFLMSGCNIVPKSVQYQQEEEKIIGTTDIMNPIVEEIQVVLNSLEHYEGNKDGRMGQRTRDAIKEFQESIGLKATGYIDKKTLRQIEDIRRESEKRELRKSYEVSVKSAYPKKPKDFPTTKEIQGALANAGFDPGAVDGKLGPRTRQAIKEFQKTKGLTPDGVVGVKTWGELGKYLK